MRLNPGCRADGDPGFSSAPGWAGPSAMRPRSCKGQVAGKAFRDAAPGPGAFPDPSAMSPDRAQPSPPWRPGEAAASPGARPPGPFPQAPRGTLNAVDFCRGPLMSGQAAPSPSYMEGQ